MAEKKLFLLDGHALVYRAHFAFIARPLINSKGINTSAITGFVRTLWDLMRNQKPTHIAVSFDPKGDTFRHEYFPEYKANREAQPEDIGIAIPYIKKILEGFKIPIITVDNYEADDVIGTLAKQAEKEGFTVYMVTPDKDYAQLVSPNIFMYKPSRQGNGVEILGVDEICKGWDIESVDQVIDVLGLQGDKVDNIPGIPGIGAKTASKLLKLYGSVESLLENTDQLKGKQKENVETYSDQALLSKRLATINIDSPVTFKAEEFIIDPMDKKVLAENLRQRAHREANIIEEANKAAEALKELEIKIAAKVGAGDKLFGSVSNADVAQAFAKADHEIDKKYISVAGGIIKRLGKYNAKVRLHREVVVDVPFDVVPEAKK